MTLITADRKATSLKVEAPGPNGRGTIAITLTGRHGVFSVPDQAASMLGPGIESLLASGVLAGVRP
jgi:hypothetical protein